MNETSEDRTRLLEGRLKSRLKSADLTNEGSSRLNCARRNL